MWKKLLAIGLLALGLSLAQAEELRVLTHSSFSLSKTLIQKFEQATGIKLRFIKGGDAGETLNKAILTKDAPIADVLYGVDNTFLSRALKAGIFEPYPSKEVRYLRSETILDPTLHAIPVDYGYVALNYDKAYFKTHPLPQTFADLAKPTFARLLAVENPATSSPGLAFLIATVDAFGEDGYLDFWAKLRDGGVKVTKGWSAAYFSAFTPYGGDRPIVVSYTTSPPAEVYFSEGKYKVPPTGNLLFPKSAFFQVEFVGILKGTRHRKAAERFIDWLLSREVQEDIPLHMWVYPARRDAKLPAIFRFAEIPTQPARVAPEVIARNRERWIRQWTDVVIRGKSPAEVKK